jgi:hypothetical protein
MSSGYDNRVDWTAHGTPAKHIRPAPPAGSRQQPPVAHTRGSVMDTLLGKNNLAAFDASGNDPYNTTGKFVRR